jgi:hypothetical protein
MTAVLVPIHLDVLMVRTAGEPFAPTKMARPAPSAANAKRQQLLPDPFGADIARPPGAYLHWSLPDGLTRAVHDGTSAPVYPAIPDRWLIVRITGDVTAGPRSLTAWLLPNVNDSPPTVLSGVLGQSAPPLTSEPPPGQALTVLGTGDLAWSAYYDNVVDVLSLYDDLSGVTGAVSYLVLGWYAHPDLDPFTPSSTRPSPDDVLADHAWSLPADTDSSAITALLCHGAAVGLGWPGPHWPGDGGTLGTEAGGPPDPSTIGVAIADTIAEAGATFGVTIDGDPEDDSGQLLMQATMAGMLSQLAQPDGPAVIDTALHTARFAAAPSADTSETIWEPSVPTPPDGSSAAATPHATGTTPPAGGIGVGNGLADAVVASAATANGVTPADDPDGPDDAGSLVDAGRSTPRVFSPTDPVLVLSGAGRAFNHGGDTRFGPEDTLQCRISGTTVTWAGAAGTNAPDIGEILPSGTDAQLTALQAPADAWPLLVETAALDPSSAPDLAAATPAQPSPDAAARAAWLADPTVLPSALAGTLPTPVGILGPVRPWTPMHVEWQLDWMPATDGIHAFTLGSVDFETPDPDALPATEAAQPLQGRSLLTASPARIAAGGTTSALALLRRAGVLDDHPVADRLSATIAPIAAAGGAAAISGAAGAVGDQDLLSGSLEGFLAQLRGENLDPIVRPPGNTSDLTSHATATDVIRAGLASLHRARVVDAFGQYVDLAGSSASAVADQTQVAVGAAEAIDGKPGLIAMLPRFNAPARVMLRYADSDGEQKDANTAISPVCGFVVPSALDGSLEFFGADGSALGRLRPDPVRATVWEEDPGEPATLGAKPSSSIPNAFLGAFADGLLTADTALAATNPAGQDLPQTALAALNQLIDTTRWTVDSSGTAGDEHLALLLGHPVAVLRAGIKIDVQSVPATSTAQTTSVPVKLGTLAHTQDGLLAYFVSDDYSRVRAVDPSVGEVVPPGGSAITSTYVDLGPSFPVQPGAPVGLTLLAVPATDVHATAGLLPQKAVGMRRDWVSDGLAQLAPNWRYGPVLIDRKVTRIPVASDVHGIWSWHHRTDHNSWATDTIVTATPAAIVPDDRVEVEYGWISLVVAPDPHFPGIPIRVRSITKPIRDAVHRIQGVAGLNGDGSSWWMTLDSAIGMVQSGRFFFFVLDEDTQTQIPIVVGVSDSGRPFLRTEFDGKETNNLSVLPEYPIMQQP